MRVRHSRSRPRRNSSTFRRNRQECSCGLCHQRRASIYFIVDQQAVARTLPTYTRLRSVRCVQKRNPKRPAASAFLNPSITPRQLRMSCRKFGLLPRRWVCYKCGGSLNTSKLEKELNMNGYRRKRKGCQARISRIHGHPIFQIGPKAIPVDQLNGISVSSTHLQYNLAHATIARCISWIRKHIVSWVRDQQASISFKDDTMLVEVEADECTLARFLSDHPCSQYASEGSTT